MTTTDDWFDTSILAPGVDPKWETEDWFDAAPPEPVFAVRAGRYRFPPPPGEKPSSNGWMRMSNLAGAFSDQRALQLWLERETLRGLRQAEDLYEELCSKPPEQLTNDYLEGLADRVRERAGANAASIRGTARHAMLEGYLNTGAINGTALMREQLCELLDVLDQAGLELLSDFAERVVWNPIAGGTCGRIDARVRCRATGQEGIADLKTKKKKFWTMQEVAGQQAGYDSATWMWEGPPDESGRWVRPPINNMIGTSPQCLGKRVALIAHMPQTVDPDDPEPPGVHIREVDVEYGRQVLATAADNVRLRSVGRSESAKRQVHGLRSPAIVG